MTNSKASLAVMAAGMGSRYGGLKQAAPIGPNGEMILDYSISDAKSAGFSKAVIIIRKDIEHDFRQAAGKRIEKLMDTEYVFQELDSLPCGLRVSNERVKPWGTGHAILCAKDAIHTPFAVINADDYYGEGVYKPMHDFLTTNNQMCMTGYKLGNTLSKNGTVSRGICDVENSSLKKVTEVTDIPWNTDIPKDTIVSMNMWGLHPDIFGILENDFIGFLKDSVNEQKKEFFLPSVIDKQIQEKGRVVKVLTTDEVWYGITYKEDAPILKEALKKVRGILE